MDNKRAKFKEFSSDEIREAIDSNKTVVMTFNKFVDMTSGNKINDDYIYGYKDHEIVEYLTKLYNIGKYKLVARRFNVDGKNILYWAPCDFSIMLLISDNIKISDKSNYIIDIKSIKDKEHDDIKYSFMGKDIKRSISNFIAGKDKYILDSIESAKNQEEYLAKLDKILDSSSEFSNYYLKNDHPMMDNVFYMVYCKLCYEKKLSVLIKSARNTDLSPRKKRQVIN